MSSEHKNNATDKLPLAVYAALIGFVAWLALAAWGFAGPGYADLSLAVVTGFLVIVIAIPFVLWRVWRANAEERADDRMSFGEWKSSQFETWQDRVKGANAAAEIVLPIAAAAVGMTAFAIVFHYAALHASA
ncbi:MAG: hypothetical protein WDO17_28660 [Alphaproteobacteria bacterium]